MDGDRFDRLARGLAAGHSRRTALKALTGSAIAGIAAVFKAGDALGAATCRRYGETCRKRGECCSDSCSPPDRTGRGRCLCSTASDCPKPADACTSAVCTRGACSTANACTSGQVCTPTGCCTPELVTVTCDGRCGSVTNNCGQSVDCGPCCSENGSSCQSDAVCCSGACIDLECAPLSGEEGPCDVSSHCQGDLFCCTDICLTCCTDSDCPGSATGCAEPVCTSAGCGTDNKPIGTPCDDNGGSVCDGDGACVECTTAEDCPPVDEQCATRGCSNNICQPTYEPYNTHVSDNTAGDCMKDVCDGQGNVITVASADDAPVPTGQCWTSYCDGTNAVSEPKAAGESCDENGGTVCDGYGNCVACVEDGDCPGIGQICCGYQCVDDSTDAQNCGGCGISCDQTSTFDVVANLVAPMVCCFGTCADLANNPNYCGSCDNPCDVEDSCCSGLCTDTSSDPDNCGACGEPCIDGSCCGGQCLDLLSNEQHCGACDSPCAPDLACCNGECVDTAIDPSHCSECFSPCDVGQTCVDSVCTDSSACDPEACAENGPSWTCCGEVCVNLNSDTEYCGTCDTNCNGPVEFSLNSLAIACCDGTCVDIYGDDANNCGACGQICNGNESCCSGTCTDIHGGDQYNCGACGEFCPNMCCDGTCVDIYGDDANNCGDCGQQCGFEELCEGGSCCSTTVCDDFMFCCSGYYPMWENLTCQCLPDFNFNGNITI